MRTMEHGICTEFGCLHADFDSNRPKCCCLEVDVYNVWGEVACPANRVVRGVPNSGIPVADHHDRFGSSSRDKMSLDHGDL